MTSMHNRKRREHARRDDLDPARGVLSALCWTMVLVAVVIIGWHVGALIGAAIAAAS